MKPEECDHGVTFDVEEARKVLSGWKAKDVFEMIMGNPASDEIKRRWPRLSGPCPKGCGFNGIAYASWEHYISGDW